MEKKLDIILCVAVGVTLVMNIVICICSAKYMEALPWFCALTWSLLYYWNKSRCRKREEMWKELVELTEQAYKRDERNSVTIRLKEKCNVFGNSETFRSEEQICIVPNCNMLDVYCGTKKVASFKSDSVLYYRGENDWKYTGKVPEEKPAWTD